MLVLLGSVFMSPAHAGTTSIVLSDNDWKPWYFSGVTEGKAGFAKDVIGICAKQAEFKPTFRFFPIERMKALMKNGGLLRALFPHVKHILRPLG